MSYLNKCKGNACKFSLEEGKEITSEMDWGKIREWEQKGQRKTLKLKGKV